MNGWGAEREREREGERESHADFLEPSAGLNPKNCEVMDLSQNQVDA